ncbi:putative F5/8 type C domain protein [Clostridium sp. D5]|nr:putative F5/8 type C domain protein [Clostridium sp. D5]
MSEVQAEGQEDAKWNEIQSVVSRYYGEWNDTSYSGAVSDKLPNTALLGNGDVGITSAGDGNSKSFYISKGDFWAYNDKPLLIGGVTIGKQKEEAADNSTNLAPNYKNVTASSYHDSFSPDTAVNGEMQESSSGYGWVSKRPQDTEQGGNPEFWLQLEYEEPITIGRYVVKSDGAVRPQYASENNTKDFALQISDTGEVDSWQSVDTVTDNTASVYDKNLDSAVSAKFVRLLITKATQETTEDSRSNPRARIGQFELYEEAKVEESENLALNKPVKVCAALTDGIEHAGSHIVDGDNNTKWCSLHDNESTHWAIVDLGEKKNIGYYSLVHSGIVGETEHNTVDYQLQYLESDTEEWSSIENTDESAWLDMDAVTGNTETITSKTFETPVSARYIRLLITNPAPSNKAARIHELELRENAPEIPDEGEPGSFYEKQDILNGEIQTTQVLAEVPTEMKTWLSADKNVMVTELKSNGSTDALLQADVWASANDKANKPITAENSADTVTVTRTTPNKDSGNPNSHVSKAAVSMKVIGADDAAAVSDNKAGKGNLKFTLKAGQSVYIVTTIGGGGRTYHNDGTTLWECEKEPAQEAQELLAEAADEASVAALNEARQAWWKDFWSTSYVDFGTEDENLNKVQKYYYGAQYILGSTAKEGELAPGLYGVWHTTDNATWHSDYHLNYNFISTFYGTNSSNRPEIAMPGIQALLDYVPEGQRRASDINEIRRINSDFVNKKVQKGDISEENGIPGAILYPVGIGPWGTTTDDVYLSEALDAAYNAYLMTQYYDYTLDEEFLNAGAYDYMKQAAAFYEAWLEKEGDEYVLYAGYNEGSWAKNPAVELAAVKNLLRHLISASETLGRDADKRETWTDIYNHLGDQPTTVVNGKKVLALGEKQWNGSSWIDLPSPIPGDGNALPLDAMIPGGVYNYFSTPEDLQMIQDTIDVFSERGAWGQINNFPRLFPEAVKSRYPIDTVVTKLVDVIDSQMVANLRINDGAHGVEKSGSTETINSMMLISDDGMTKIFPNWYADKDATFSGLRAKGAFIVSASYDGAAQEAKDVVITSEKGETMTLVTPWAEGATVRDSAGNVVKTEAGTVPNWEDEKTITFATAAGETYTVEKGEAPVELDYDAIDKAIAEAEAIKQDGYTQESYQALQDAIKNAKDARQNATTQDELTQKKDELRAAIDGLRGSKTILETFLTRAKQHVENGDVDKLVESVQKLFAEAIAEGEAVMENESATKDDVLTASLKLMKAIQALDMKAGDKADLGMALELTNMIDLAQYVEKGQAEYLAAKAEAERVMGDGDAMQPEVDAAWAELVDRMMDLRLKADKSTLSDLLDSVKDIDLSKYTDESVKVFTDALAKANAVMDDETLSVESQAEVDKTVKLLADARDGLTEKKGSGGNNNNGNQNGNNGNQNGGGQNGNNGNGTNNNGSANQGIKTGDAVRVFVPIIGLVLSLGAVAAVVGVFLKRRRR